MRRDTPWELLLLIGRRVYGSFFRRNELEDYFEFVYSSNNLFGKHRTINRVIRNHGLSLENTFYVGDETRDIESAKKK